jgi:hypothetical protein
MTIDLDMIIEEDLSLANNKILNLPANFSSDTRFSGIEFLMLAQSHESRTSKLRECFEIVLQRFSVARPSLTIWLFVCSSTWRPKSAVVRYFGLWRSFQRSNILLPSGDRTVEKQIESSEGIRFFGVVHVPAGEADRVHGVLDSEPSSFVIGTLTSHPPALDDRLLTLWQDYRPEFPGEVARLAEIVCRDGGLLFRPFGAFDDREVGIDVILNADDLPLWRAALTGSLRWPS